MKNLLLLLFFFSTQISFQAFAFDPNKDCNPDFEKFSTKCEKYWLAQIPHLARRKRKDELELRLASGKKIIFKDEEVCTCDCGMIHVYLAGYYPQLNKFLIYRTYLFGWDYKTNNYKYPVEDYITDGGVYSLALPSFNEEKPSITPHHSVINSPFYKNKFITYSSVPSSKQGINLITINKDLAKEEFDIHSEIGRIESPRWIDKNTITYTKTFQKDKLPSRQVMLKFDGKQWMEAKNNQLFKINDTRFGKDLLDYCKSFPVNQTLDCLHQLEAEAIASINKDNYKKIKIQKLQNRYIINLEDKCLMFEPEYINLDKNKLFFIDESDSNFLFAKVLSEGNFNYLIFNSNIGTISVYSLMP
ncbi:MAG: hypothetical protein SFU25_10200, partial [Candidatus Caenarcaniphilales bacterium]|nr:hypothetical protein [Candidatus Caenarcaniphilales bacterium]